jgi:hypothetical protein
MPTTPTFLLMSSVSSNLLPFSVDLIVENKKKSGGDKSGRIWGREGVI